MAGVVEFLVAAGYTPQQIAEMTMTDALDLFIMIFELESGNEC